MTPHKLTVALALLVASIGSAIVSAGGGAPAAPPQIVMRDLGFAGQATAINDHGHVAGTLTGGTAAIFWTDNTGPIAIPPLPGHIAAVATAINNRDQVVGYSYPTNSDDAHAFIWSLAEGLRDLGPGAAFGINDDGTVVGSSATWYGRARMWQEDGTTWEMGTLGSVWSEAHDINRNGQAVGHGWTTSGDTHGVTWPARSAIRDMGFIGWAFAINDRAHAFVRMANARPALWSAVTNAVPLVTPGCHDNWGGGINNTEWIVSAWKTCDGREQMHAFVWSAEAGVTDLADHVLTDIIDYDTWAWDVNERGQVAGAVTDPAHGREHAVVWHLPVPVPARIRSLETAIAVLAANGSLSAAAARQLQGRVADVKLAFASADARAQQRATTRLRLKLASDLHAGKLEAAQSWLLESANELTPMTRR